MVTRLLATPIARCVQSGVLDRGNAVPRMNHDDSDHMRMLTLTLRCARRNVDSHGEKSTPDCSSSSYKATHLS
jgi:hypothetical protein